MLEQPAATRAKENWPVQRGISANARLALRRDRFAAAIGAQDALAPDMATKFAMLSFK
ncbi:MAG: hypothetical protein K1000chlam2_00344 [Chlamydiae bacterium]|nr:hypothetical protein [Chlamydiota bacterium]